MRRPRTKDIQIVPPNDPLQCYTPQQAAARLGLSVRQLAEMRVQLRGPRFKKLGESPQSRVIYPAKYLAEYVNRLRTVETEGLDETQKAS